MDIIDTIDLAIGCQNELCGRPLDGSPSDDFCSGFCQQVWHEACTVPLLDYVEPYDLPQYVGNLEEMYSAEITPSLSGQPHFECLGLAPVDVMARLFDPVQQPSTLDTVVYTVTADTGPVERSCAAAARALGRLADHLTVSTMAIKGFVGVWVDETTTFSSWADFVTLDLSRLSPATLDLSHIEIGPVARGTVTFDMLHDVRVAADPAVPDPPVDVRSRALTAQRNRNAGPPPPRRRAPRNLPPRRSR